MNTPHTFRTCSAGDLDLELRWHRVADRYASEIRVLDRDAPSPAVLRSVEGDDRQHWPQSPAIQQLTHQGHAAGEFVLMGLGMAGRSHWSLSIVTLPAECPTVEFDVACRVKEEPAMLGSAYEVGEGTLIGIGANAEIEMRDCFLLVEPIPTEAATIVQSTEKGGFHITPHNCGDVLPRTVRWKYRISATRSAG